MNTNVFTSHVLRRELLSSQRTRAFSEGSLYQTDTTLKEAFRYELLQEFIDYLPALAPGTDRYKPFLAIAVEIGLLELKDLGLPENKVTMRDFENSNKDFVKITKMRDEEIPITFYLLDNSSITLFSVNFIIEKFIKIGLRLIYK